MANSHSADIMELQRSLWQHPDMIEFRTLADDHPDLTHSPLLRGALLTFEEDVGLARESAVRLLPGDFALS